MSTVRFIGCLHLKHEWMAKHRGFEDSVDHDTHLIKSWNDLITKRDLTYILGDISMENPDAYKILDKLNGRKKVILGNHDLGKHIPELLKYVDSVSGMQHYKGFWLTHAPVHPNELAFVRGNIHAHIHAQALPYTEVKVDYWDKSGIIKSKEGKGYYNVDAFNIDFKPKSLDELHTKVEHFEKNNKHK